MYFGQKLPKSWPLGQCQYILSHLWRRAKAAAVSSLTSFPSQCPSWRLLQGFLSGCNVVSHWARFGQMCGRRPWTQLERVSCRWYRRMRTSCSALSVHCAMWRNRSPAVGWSWCTAMMRSRSSVWSTRYVAKCLANTVALKTVSTNPHQKEVPARERLWMCRHLGSHPHEDAEPRSLTSIFFVITIF